MCRAEKRGACPRIEDVSEAVEPAARKNGSDPKALLKEESSFEESKVKGVSSGGYLIGRHPECDVVVDDPIVSNRHCLLFTEHKGNDTVAILEDLSSNGTFVNEAIVGRNQRRELQEQDEIAVLDKARFVFRYPKTRLTSAFLQQYTPSRNSAKDILLKFISASRSLPARDMQSKSSTRSPVWRTSPRMKDCSSRLPCLWVSAIPTSCV